MNERAAVSWRVAAVALIVALGVLSGSARADTETPIAGTVSALEGKPKIQRVGSKGWKRLKFGDMVHEGDTVKTDSGERVGIAFQGGAELRINENSSFTVEEGSSRGRPSVFTQFGDAWTRLLHKANLAQSMQIATPIAVAAVRGTEADVDFSGGPMSVKVYEGHVDVSDPRGNGSVTVKAGQGTTVGGAGQAPQPPRALSPQDYGTWQNAVKPQNLGQSLKLLDQAADKNRTLELRMMKDGQQKKIKLNLEKK